VKALYALYNIYLTFKRQENMWKPQPVYWYTGTWVLWQKSRLLYCSYLLIYNARTEHLKWLWVLRLVIPNCHLFQCAHV